MKTTDSIADAVIFDLDGTITDTEKYYQTAWREALEHFGCNAAPEMLLELRSLGRPFAQEKLNEWFGEDCSFDEVLAECKRIVNGIIDKNGIDLKPGVSGLLEFLHEKGIASALATSNDLETIKKNLDKAGIAGCFDRIICADMVPAGKPAPDIYIYACEQLGIRPDRAFAVEDSPNGVISAFNAGCRVIMVPDLTEPDEMLQSMLYARADSLDEIKELLTGPAAEAKDQLYGQIRRIRHFEAFMQEADRKLKDTDAFADDPMLASWISELGAYYGSSEWKQDFEADEAGLLPPGLKRGVLSEDGIFNLLSEYDEFIGQAADDEEGEE